MSLKLNSLARLDRKQQDAIPAAVFLQAVWREQQGGIAGPAGRRRGLAEPHPSLGDHGRRRDLLPRLSNVPRWLLLPHALPGACSNHCANPGARARCQRHKGLATGESPLIEHRSSRCVRECNPLEALVYEPWLWRKFKMLDRRYNANDAWRLQAPKSIWRGR